MQDDIFERRVAVMTVRTPSTRTQVHLDIPTARRIRADFDYSAAKIGSALNTMKSRMQYPDGLTVQSLEIVSPQALMEPDGLEQAFGRRVVLVAQLRHDAASHAPLPIKAAR
jgi:hypothetical protein